MFKNSYTSCLAILLISCVHFQSFCEAKIEIINKNSKTIVYTIYENHITISPESYDFFSNVQTNKTYIIAADSADTCENLKPPPYFEIVDTRKSNDITGKSNNQRITLILLSIAQPHCNIEEMAQSAGKLGYSSLILYGDLSLLDAKISNPNQIPTFFISVKDANLLREKYSYPKRYYVRITENVPFFTSLVEMYYVACAILFTILTHWITQCIAYGFLAIIFFCRLLGYRFGFGFDFEAHQFQFQTRGGVGIYSLDDLSPAFRRRNIPMDRIRLLNQLLLAQIHQHKPIRLPTIQWQPQEEKDDTCSICLDHFSLNQELNTLPCDHYFHKECIETWLSSGRRICPLCRHPVVTDRENLLEQLVREYAGLNNNPDWIQERQDRLRDTWYNLNW